ncbi:MAG TPA: DUF3619 family protein [Burkholderiales bacterium]|nr:DUF3619 family protein [Burkholderiales bacterium]
MNDQEELGRAVARLLDEGTGAIDAEARTRLIEARSLAVARHRVRPARGLVPAVVEGISDFTERTVLGVRYIVPMAALVLGLIGVMYVHTGSAPSEIADIDAGLLTDELPINAFLDQGFDAWLKRSSR